MAVTDWLKYLFPCTAIALAACGGVSSPAEMTLSNPYATLTTLETDLGRQVLMEPLSEPSQVFGGGSAIYNGVITGAINDGNTMPRSLSGNLTVETHFTNGSSTITGGARDFFENDGTSVDGQLELVDGFFDTTVDSNVDYTVSASLIGTLSVGDSDELDLSIKMEGDFYGLESNIVAGGANGIVQQQSNNLTFEGRFVASSITSE